MSESDAVKGSSAGSDMYGLAQIVDRLEVSTDWQLRSWGRVQDTL